MKLGELGEFGLIGRISKWLPPARPGLIRGIGDDVAVVDMGRKALLITTDLLIEGVHFDRSWTAPYRLGKKSLAVNLSDIAATGGTPTYFVISLGLPRDLPLSFISDFYRGLRETAKRFQVDLVGGDTSLSQKIIVNICLFGEGRKGRLLFRNGASAGDRLFVSGTLGDAALGLKILKRKGMKAGPRGLVEKHLSPLPRLALGQALAGSGWATAMIDVSDGLLIDTRHVLEESQAGARIWENRIPLSRRYRRWILSYARRPYELALSGGEDYELLFTAPPQHAARIFGLAASLRVPVSAIGEILPRGEGFRIIRRDGKAYSPSRWGFEHFRRTHAVKP